MTNASTINPNILWATTFVAELAASGLTAVSIAPGSRSTPLTLAFAAHPKIQVYAHIDERSAAFFALGLAQATDRPVAIVCTSGTATANFHPAIIEAHQAQVPLLVLTGDRPHELRHSGANQTIDQVKMFGDHVLWSVDMGLPEISLPDVALNNVRATAARAFATADGTMTGLRKGAVHINFPFRKPLEPADPQLHIFDESIFEDNEASGTPRHRILQGCLTPTTEQVDELAALINRHEMGLIVVGPLRLHGESARKFAAALMALSQRSGYPILADPLSGVRFGYDQPDENARIVSSYETFLAAGVDAQSFDQPDVVIRFGAVPTSKWLNAYLDGIAPLHRVHVRENGVWADDNHKTTLFLQANEAEICCALAEAVMQRGDGDWSSRLLQTEKSCRQATQDALDSATFDAAYMLDLVNMLPQNARLFMGNSLPIRHLDQFCGPTGQRISVYGNRGASGIDGTVSCALGVAAAGSDPLVLALGDVTFAHDLNGLLAAKQVIVDEKRVPVTIVLFNNGGGGIFRRLPIAKFEPPFEALFLTPQALDFESIVRGYGWAFVSVNRRADFCSVFESSLHDWTPTVIEVVTDGTDDHVAWQACGQQIRQRI